MSSLYFTTVVIENRKRVPYRTTVALSDGYMLSAFNLITLCFAYGKVT